MKSLIFKHILSAIKVLIGLAISLFIVSFMYIFYHAETHFLGINYINPFYSYVEYMPVWIYLVLYFIFFSLLIAFIFISLSHYFNVEKSISLRIKNRYYHFFTYVLSSYLLLDIYNDDDSRKNLFLKIKPFLKTRKQILAFFESYLKIQETITKDLSVDFILLINDSNLQSKMESLMFNKAFDDKILAMKMLSYLQIHSCDKQIVLNAKSENVALRTEAYAALIRLMKKDEHLLYYIGEDHQLSILDINIIVNALLYNHKVNIDYKQLLFSINPQKIMIVLILIKYRLQKNEENLFLIEDHLESTNNLIKKFAWNALLALVPDEDCVNVIFERFENENEAIKLNILEKSEHIISAHFFKFLAYIMEHQPLLVKIEAIKILFHNDFDLLEKFVNSPNDEIRMAYEEATCMYLND